MIRMALHNFLEGKHIVIAHASFLSAAGNTTSQYDMEIFLSYDSVFCFCFLACYGTESKEKYKK